MPPKEHDLNTLASQLSCKAQHDPLVCQVYLVSNSYWCMLNCAWKSWKLHDPDMFASLPTCLAFFGWVAVQHRCPKGASKRPDVEVENWPFSSDDPTVRLVESWVWSIGQQPGREDVSLQRTGVCVTA